MAKKERLYLAGPMRGRPASNFAAFDTTKKALEGMGYVIISPADLTRANGYTGAYINQTPDKPEELLSPSRCTALIQDFLSICFCDGVALMPEWTESLGARAERAFAEAVGIECMLVSNWIQRKRLLNLIP